MELVRTLAKLLIGAFGSRSYSQYGEDVVAGALLRKVKHGIYIDVGAYHPIQYSNTYAFYRKGGKGIVIDPNPRMKNLFSFFRPRDTFIEAAVGKEAGPPLVYYLYEDGAFNTLSAAHVERIATKNKVQPIGQKQVSVRTLADIVTEQKLERIDLLSVDVEGMDLAVIEGYDWKVRPSVIVIEDHDFSISNPQGSAIYRFLEDKGYSAKSVAGLSVIYRDQAAT